MLINVILLIIFISKCCHIPLNLAFSKKSVFILWKLTAFRLYIANV